VRDTTAKRGVNMFRSIRSAGFLLFTVSALLAQKATAPTSGNAGSSGSSGGKSPTGPSNQPSANPSQQQQQQQQQQQEPIPVFLYGRVMMDDGSPPPIGIAIKQTCTGSPRTVAFTSSKGQFNLQLGKSNLGSVFDASEGFGGNDGFGGIPGVPGSSGNGLSGPAGFSSRLAGCELSAEAAGFRSDRIDLGSRLANDNPDVGVIVLHRIAGVEGTSVSATSFNAPKDARKAWEKGIQNLHAAQSSAASPRDRGGSDAKLASAEKELLNAVTIYPKFANAWSDLGHTRLLRNDTAGAREAFLKALAADNKLVEPYVGLGEQSMRDKDWKAAADYMGKALQLDAVDYPGLWFQDAIANYNLQNYDRAEKATREALKLPAGKVNPNANQLLGILLMNKRDLPGAKEAFNAFLKTSSKSDDAARVRQQLDEIDRQLADSAH
jgi:TolA-binding protein